MMALAMTAAAAVWRAVAAVGMEVVTRRWVETVGAAGVVGKVVGTGLATVEATARWATRVPRNASTAAMQGHLHMWDCSYARVRCGRRHGGTRGALTWLGHWRAMHGRRAGAVGAVHAVARHRNMRRDSKYTCRQCGAGCVVEARGGGGRKAHQHGRLNGYESSIRMRPCSSGSTAPTGSASCSSLSNMHVHMVR